MVDVYAVERAIESYLKENEVYGNVVYCFRDKDLKESFPKPVYKKDEEYYTELLIEIKGDRICLSHKNSPIFIYGEYKKFSREMTQTPLRIKGKLKCQRSVSDFTSQIKDAYGAKEVVFIPSGREDIDVRNLGGRPFLLKIKEPTRNLFMQDISLDLCAEIQLENLKRVSKKAKETILEGEQDKRKIYRCLVSSPVRLDIKKEYKIDQKTPLRVLHRRANLCRKKEVEILNVVEEGRWLYTLDLRASAGTYIKEFVSGDFGRTSPSLSSEGNLVEMVYLDVLKIEGVKAPEEIGKISLRIK